MPENGHRQGDDFRFGATVRYECEEGFQPAGPLSRVCLTTGLWNGFLLTCVPPRGKSDFALFAHSTEAYTIMYSVDSTV